MITLFPRLGSWRFFAARQANHTLPGQWDRPWNFVLAACWFGFGYLVLDAAPRQAQVARRGDIQSQSVAGEFKEALSVNPDLAR